MLYEHLTLQLFLAKRIHELLIIYLHEPNNNYNYTNNDYIHDDTNNDNSILLLTIITDNDMMII